jgi:hypothetical protein
MSDQALEQSPQEKLMAMLDEVPDEESVDLDAEEQQIDEIEEDETPDEGDESEEEKSEDDNEEEADSEEQPASLKLKVNGEEINKPLEPMIRPMNVSNAGKKTLGTVTSTWSVK